MKLAFVFPGQGSQTVGMLDSFADNAVVQAALKTANDALGENLAEMIHSGPAESLNMTVNTQPAMLTSSVALYQAWLALGGKKPEVMAGHSLGEYSALTAAGVFDLADAVVSAPFHSSLMKPASVALRAKLEETPMSAPEIDVVANVDVKVHKDKEAIIEALASQAAGAVQWVKTIQAFKEMGVTHIVECGPGRVLAGLIKRIDSSIVVKNINSQDSLVAVLEEINAAE